VPEQPVGFAAQTESPFSGSTEYVSPGFFATAGVLLLRGRDFAWTDTPAGTPVAVISESLARALASEGDVLGRVIRHGTSPATARLQIVGVVGNVSMGNFRLTDPPMIYLSSIQARETAFATVHIRTEGPPMLLARPASEVIASFGREHVRGAYSEVLFTNSIVAERMGSIVSTAAAGLALVISCIGLFALMAHSVQRRTREIGIRLAIGATPAAVSRAVFRDALTLVAAGAALGIPAAISATSIVSTLLYGVTSTDGTTLVGSMVLMICTAGLAAALPARRAVRVDPATALRSE
jgi:ABC-type antimicrobial peptide transport system permease subunit